MLLFLVDLPFYEFPEVVSLILFRQELPDALPQSFQGSFLDQQRRPEEVPPQESQENYDDAGVHQRQQGDEYTAVDERYPDDEQRQGSQDCFCARVHLLGDYCLYGQVDALLRHPLRTDPAEVAQRERDPDDSLEILLVLQLHDDRHNDKVYNPKESFIDLLQEPLYVVVGLGQALHQGVSLPIELGHIDLQEVPLFAHPLLNFFSELGQREATFF